MAVVATWILIASMATYFKALRMMADLLEEQAAVNKKVKAAWKFW